MEGSTLTDRAAVKQALVGKDYIETIDWTVEELEEVLAVSHGAEGRAQGRASPTCCFRRQTLYMLFLDKSTRTRNAFETGMTQLGGHAIFLDADKTQVSHGESPKDMGIILGRYGEGIAIRHDLAPYEGSAWMREVAEWADIPLINLQCDIDHPTQTIADVMTLKEHRGDDLRGLKVAMTWAYAPSYARPLSVPQGVATLFPRFGMDVVIAHPPGLRADARGDREGAGGRRRGRLDDHVHGRHGRGVPRRGRRLPEVVGPARRVQRRVEGARRVRRVRGLDLRRPPHGARRTRRALHALPAGRPRPRGHRRGHRRPAVGRLRRGREPDAHRQGADGPDDGRLRAHEPRRAPSSRSAATR